MHPRCAASSGCKGKGPESPAAIEACDDLSRLVALIPWSPCSQTPPQLRVPSTQRFRPAAWQRGAAAAARITSNTSLLAGP